MREHVQFRGLGDVYKRLGLLGRNGNGKTTLARLLAAQLRPMAGDIAASAKMRVGYFTQYQVEELDPADTPLDHMTRAMKGATPAAVRAQLGRFGFSGPKATTRVGAERLFGRGADREPRSPHAGDDGRPAGAGRSGHGARV